MKASDLRGRIGLPLASAYDAGESPLDVPGRKRSALVQSDKNRLGKKMFARLVLHLPARGILADPQVPCRERQKTEKIMMRSVAAWRVRPAIAGFPEVIERLLKSPVSRAR